jgi:NADPH:quinone reductase-like Zn-dependent oxidoreductase
VNLPPDRPDRAADYLEDTMRAIVIDKFGGPERLVYTELPEPEPKLAMSVAIKVSRINHAEMDH